MKKTLLQFTFIFALFALLGAGCVFGGGGNQVPDSEQNQPTGTENGTEQLGQEPNTKEAPNPDAPQSADAMDTSDWLIYENQEYGFEFRYPSVWHTVTAGIPKTDFKLILDLDSKEGELNNGGIFSATPFKIKEKQTFEESVHQILSENEKENIKSINFFGFEAYRVDGKAVYAGKVQESSYFQRIFVQKNKEDAVRFYVFVVGREFKETLKILETILGTIELFPT
jgi:hypothetical protein